MELERLGIHVDIDYREAEKQQLVLMILSRAHQTHVGPKSITFVGAISKTEKHTKSGGAMLNKGGLRPPAVFRISLLCLGPSSFSDLCVSPFATLFRIGSAPLGGQALAPAVNMCSFSFFQ